MHGPSVKYSYIGTPLSPGECRRRLAERVGNAHWRWWGTGLGRACDRPLCGTVDEYGFDVMETGPGGFVIGDPRIRGRWGRVRGRTIVRVGLYSKWYEWAGIAFGAGVLGLLAAVVVTFFRPLRVSTFCLMALCFAVVVMGMFLKRHHARMTSQAEALASKAAVLFEGEIIEEVVGLQSEMEMDGRWPNV